MKFSTTAVIIGKTFEYNYQYEQYLEQAALIVVLDSAILHFLKFKPPFIPHVLLGDFDEPIDTVWVLMEFPSIKIVHTPDQNKTDFDKAIEYVIAQGYKKIIGLGLTGRRMDHTLNNMSSMGKYNEQAYIQLVDDYSIVECITRVYNKEHKKGTKISLLPLGEVQGVITQNLKYTLMNEPLTLGTRTGNSNEVAQDGAVIITISKGKLLVMECWD
jgi:thiamine pyrophosphokinase